MQEQEVHQKAMFLCAQAYPCKVNGEWWDGKIGLWQIGQMVRLKEIPSTIQWVLLCG